MTEKAISIFQAAKVPDGSAMGVKPAYLVSLTSLTKNSPKKLFVATDMSELHEAYVKVKGYFTNQTEEEVVATVQQVLTSSIDKDMILEMYFPWARVLEIRNLIFRAKK